MLVITISRNYMWKLKLVAIYIELHVKSLSPLVAVQSAFIELQVKYHSPFIDILVAS